MRPDFESRWLLMHACTSLYINWLEHRPAWADGVRENEKEAGRCGREEGEGERNPLVVAW